MASAADELRSPTLGKRPDRVAKGSSPGPMTRRMRTALAAPEDLKLAGPKSLFDEDDEDFTPGAESEVEEEFDEGDADRNDERPPFADGGLLPADPALVQQLDANEDDADDGEFGAAEAAEGEAEEIAEEYDEGPVVDDERPHRLRRRRRRLRGGGATTGLPLAPDDVGGRRAQLALVADAADGAPGEDGAAVRGGPGGA